MNLRQIFKQNKKNQVLHEDRDLGVNNNQLTDRSTT